MAKWLYNGETRPSFAIETNENQESVWDYPRPPICVLDNRSVIVSTSCGKVIAETSNAVRVLETASPPTFYIPRTDVDFECLCLGSGRSFCEWKGTATYWSVSVPGSEIANVGWSYEDPTRQFTSIRQYISFYPGKLNCKVDDEEVRPQPGEFYGGWLTDEVFGPFKGEPGTSGW